MKRILPAFVVAALIHAFMLTMDTRWLIRHDPIAPRTQVTTMRLVDRAPFAPTAIHPLPAAPSPLPPTPKKPPVNPKPVKKKPKTSKKKTTQKVPVPPPPEPSPTLPPRAFKPEPSAPIEDVKPAVSNQPLSSAETLSPSTTKETDRITDRRAADVTAVIKATPRYSDNPPPAYPSIARKRGYQGTVVLDVFVEADGQVGDLRIIESSHHKILDRSAMKAVKRWRFEPGRQGNQPIAMWVRVPVRFSLR